jgi:HK97 family phage major capsid protein
VEKQWIKLLRDYDGHKAGETLHIEKRDAALLIKSGTAEDAGDGPEEAILGEAMTQLRTAFSETMTGLVEDMRNATTAARGVRIDLVQSQADKTRGLGEFLQCVTLVQKAGDEAAAEKLRTVYNSGFVADRDNQDPKKERSISRRMTEATGSAGGFVLPDDLESTILRLDPEEAVVAGNVRTINMTGPTKKFPALRQTTNPSANASAMHAGVRTYYKSEKAQRTASEMQLDQIALEANDLISYTEFERDLLADAPALEADAKMLFQEANTWRMDQVFIAGDGIGKPLGIENSKCLIKVTRNTSNKVLYEDIVAMLASLMTRSWDKAYWIANVTVFPQIAALKDAAGNNLFVSSANAGATNAPSGTLLGKKIKFTEKVPVLGSTFDLNLWDPSCFLHGLRAGVEIGVSEDFLFDTDGIAFRTKVRHDGQAWLKDTYKQADGSNTPVSPFVSLN